MEKNEKFLVSLLVITLIIGVFNQIQLFSMKSDSSIGISNPLSGVGNLPTGVSLVSASVIPSGVPKIYGKELNVKYDDISPNDPQLANQKIAVLGNLDKTITLSGDDLQRYIRIASQISCEYCCGAKSIIFSTGQPACGCAHSYAMRGLAKYMITKHGKEVSDDEILSEMAKWKTLFFPGVMQSKADALKGKGIEFNYVNLGSNKYRGIEKGQSSSGGMVGGC